MNQETFAHEHENSFSEKKKEAFTEIRGEPHGARRFAAIVHQVTRTHDHLTRFLMITISINSRYCRDFS